MSHPSPIRPGPRRTPWPTAPWPTAPWPRPAHRPWPTAPWPRALALALAVGVLLALASAGATTARAATTGAPNLLTQLPLYVNPSSMAAHQSKILVGDNQKAASLIASVPLAKWIAPTDGMDGITSYLAAAAAAHQLPQLVIYGLPDRDCNGFSAGASTTPAAYASWVGTVRKAIAGRPTLVVVEPDGLADGGCQPGSAPLAARLGDIAAAVDALSVDATTAVYIDAGHEQWLTPAEAAQRLQTAHVTKARGFSLNVSNMYSSATEIAYGQQISALIGNKTFVVDTSRNGAGSAPAAALNWCNPAGRLAGPLPQGVTGTPGLDGVLWIKAPGESDGSCRSGEPSSGAWYASWATTFAKNSLSASGQNF